MARGHRKAAEALQREQATSEILRIIGTSPGNTQVVFDAIVKSAVELIPGSNAGLYVRDGEVLHNVANAASGETHALSGREDIPVVVLDLIPGPLWQDDDLANRSANGRRFYEEFGLRSRVTVKLLTHGHPVGLLFVSQRDAFAFTTEHVSLLQTFADQAVIAIENARLFNELEDSNREIGAALERETATAVIMSAISSSPGDLHSALSAIGAAASRMCKADSTSVAFTNGGQWSVWSPLQGVNREAAVQRVHQTLIGDACRDNAPALFQGTVEELEARFPVNAEFARVDGWATVQALAVPLRGPHGAFGGVLVRREQGDPFGTPKYRCFSASLTRPSSPSRTRASSRNCRNALAR